MTQFPYESLLDAVILFGDKRTDRTGVGTRSLFSPQSLFFDLRGNKVPLITSKRVAWKMARDEFLWMLSGSTDVYDLAKTNLPMGNIWFKWADVKGDIGPTYGAQYRDAGGTLVATEPPTYGAPYSLPVDNYGVDQLQRVIDLLAKTPDTRRAVISLWSAPELDAMNLEPCMVLFQFSLRGENYDKLELHIYQRSADMMLGVPFDLFQGGMFTHLVARELSIITGRDIKGARLTWSAGDVHIYENHLEPAKLQLDQLLHAEPMRARIELTNNNTHRLLDGTLKSEDITVTNYNPEPAINVGPPAV